MILPLAQITELVPMIDRASEASNRWLFLASLVVIMIGGAAVIRWLVKALDKKDITAAAERSDLHLAITSERNECRLARKEDQTQFLVALAAKDATMTAHTKAIEALTGVVTKHDTDMRAAHEIELRSMIRSEIDKRTNSKDL